MKFVTKHAAADERKKIHHARVVDTGNLAKPLADTNRERDGRLGRWVCRRRQTRLHLHDAGCAKTGIHRSHPHETLEQKTGAAQQHDRERQLDDDEHTAQPVVPTNQRSRRLGEDIA